MAKKTSINNLNIVWQGQSWSVIAPNGVVLGRYKEKYLAESFAENNLDYVEELYEDYAEVDFTASRRYRDGEREEHNPYDYAYQSKAAILDDVEIIKRKRSIETKPESYPLVRATQYLLALPVFVILSISALAILAFGLWDVFGRFFQAGFGGAVELFLKHYLELSLVFVFLTASILWLNVEPRKLDSSHYRSWLIWALFSFGLGIPVGFISFWIAAFYLIWGVSSFVFAIIFSGNLIEVLNNYGFGAFVSCAAFGLAAFCLHNTEDKGRNL